MVAVAQFLRPLRQPGRRMSKTDSIEAASHRLTLALEALDEAAERRREADRGVEALANQVHALDNERSRLAGELDPAAAWRPPVEKWRSASIRPSKPSAACWSPAAERGRGRRVEQSLCWGEGQCPRSASPSTG